MRLYRSLLYVPGNRRDLIEKIERFEADAYILDLEDGVPPLHKPEARRALTEVVPALLKAGRRIHVRVNPVHSPWHREDLEAALASGVTALHVPKLTSAEDLRGVDLKVLDLAGRLGVRLDQLELFPTVETSRGVIESDLICAASARVSGVVLGGDDLTAEWGVERTAGGEELGYVRSAVVVAASAYGALPIDATFPFHRDLDGCAQDARRARSLGFRGKQAIHPAQCPILNQAFTPSAEEVARARLIVAAAETARGLGRGTAAAAGTQIDAAVEKSARRLIEWAEGIAAGGA